MVEVYNNQQVVEISDLLLEQWAAGANLALPLCMKNPAHDGGVLADLAIVEVSIVDDATIDQVHRDFMNIPGATDVITFAHGEIVVSSETARFNASEYGNSFENELMLYMIHGLLHLAGHEDALAIERDFMEKLQDEILKQVCVMIVKRCQW